MEKLGMNYKAKTGAVVALTLQGESAAALQEAASAIRAKRLSLYNDPYTDETYLYGRTETGIRFSSENDPLRITWEERDGEDFPAVIEGTIWVR